MRLVIRPSKEPASPTTIVNPFINSSRAGWKPFYNTATTDSTFPFEDKVEFFASVKADVYCIMFELPLRSSLDL